MIAIPTGVKWSLSVILVYIPFMAKDAEHFFMYLLAICISSLESYLLNSFAHLLIGLLVLSMFKF
jgi:hypothetical protein